MSYHQEKVATNLTESPLFKLIGIMNPVKTEVSFYYGNSSLLAKTSFDEINEFKNTIQTKDSNEQVVKKPWWKIW